LLLRPRERFSLDSFKDRPSLSLRLRFRTGIFELSRDRTVFYFEFWVNLFRENLLLVRG